MSTTRAFTRTTTGDFPGAGVSGSGAFGTVVGARLATAAANATAQIVDANGTVLYNLSAIAGYADECDIEVRFEGKVTLGAISGAGAAVTVYVS